MTLDGGAATFTLLQRFSHAVAVKQGNLGCSTFPVSTLYQAGHDDKKRME